MENNSNYPQGIQPVLQSNNTLVMDPQKNKFAIMSLISSIVSFLLFPLMIFQIVGIVFGILGIKSEKKGMAVTGIVLSSVTVFLGITSIFAIIAFNQFSSILYNAKAKADVQNSAKIQTAIVEYIDDTGDVGLSFGAREKPSVEKIVSSLQNSFTIKGKQYGPYLPTSKDGTSYMPANAKGWKISVDKSNGAVKVKVVASEEANSVEVK